METAITALIVIGVMLLAILSVSDRSITAQSVISEAAREMQEREGERARTNLEVLSATSSAQGQFVQVTVKNSGLTKLADFQVWDVLLDYSDGTAERVRWYPYGSGVNKWDEQLYQVASPPSAEFFDPGIFNPGEEMVITVEVSPAVGSGTTNLVSITSPNGITASAVFTR
jgi:flagellar protein FlaF